MEEILAGLRPKGSFSELDEKEKELIVDIDGASSTGSKMTVTEATPVVLNAQEVRITTESDPAFIPANTSIEYSSVNEGTG